MGNFYNCSGEKQNHLRLYSERGLLSFLFHHVMLDDPGEVMNAAKNARGHALCEMIAAPWTYHRIYTEFDLGAQGFGCPDGALFVRSAESSIFVFIEAKAIPFDASFQDPSHVAASIENVDWDRIEMKSLVGENSFNTAINGQLELKWRFVNALRARPANQWLVTEQNCGVPMLLRQSDRFYWRRRLQPNAAKKGHWRRVEMGGDLRPLLEDLLAAQKFCLLCITADEKLPTKLSSVRLLMPDGTKMVDAPHHLFWLPLRFIEDRLHRQ